MKFADRPVVFTLIAAVICSVIALHAPICVSAQQTDDPRRAELYNCWYANRDRNPAAANDCGKQFLTQYGSTHDKYAIAVAKFVWEFENSERVKFEGLFRAVASASETEQPVILNRLLALGVLLLKKEPGNLSLQIRLGQAGYLAQKRKIETYSTDAVASAENAIIQIEAGESPEASFNGYPAEYLPKSPWVPFESKDDALAHLQYAVGYLYQLAKPDRAAAAFYRATQYETELKSDPVAYALLAIAYDTSAWEQASRKYRALDPGAAEREAALNTLYQITDRLLTYYARAVALSGQDSARQQVRETAMTRLEVLYRFRHENSTNGMPEFIRDAAQLTLASPDALFDPAEFRRVSVRDR